MALSTEKSNERHTCIALCAGAGGLELGMRIADPGHQVVCWVERDAYAAATLVARMEDKALDEAPIWSDLRTFDGQPWRGKVDIITAGYPCQPFSLAGKRLGKSDPRHLWPDVARIIEEVGPGLVFCENVPGHLNNGFDLVCKDMEKLGYKVEAIVVSAAELGNSHIRERMFFLGHSNSVEFGSMAGDRGTAEGVGIQAGRRVSGGDSVPSNSLDLSFPHGACKEESSHLQHTLAPFPNDVEAWERLLSDAPGLQPAVSRTSDGLAHRMDRSRLCGNGVFPLAAAYAWTALTKSIQLNSNNKML